MVNQLPFDDTAWQRPPRARRADPASSHAAADRLERSGRAAAQMRLVLEFVRRFPRRTSKELAQLAAEAEVQGVDRYTFGRRLPDLEGRGLVEIVDADGRATTRGEARGELRWRATG